MNTSHSSQNAASSFSQHLHGIPCMHIAAGSEQVCIAAQGAQVLSWIDQSGRERLYLSPQTLCLDPASGEQTYGPAIRGGVPISFPQFSDRGPMTKHGFVRNRMWSLENSPAPSVTGTPPPSSATLRFAHDDSTHDKWPHRFDARTRVHLRPGQLEVRLEVQNTGDTPFSFTVALHTYLRVDDIRQAAVLGLQGVSFEDATRGCLRSVQEEEILQISAEIDRVYLKPPGKLLLCERGEASLSIEQRGFVDTVVWNPGPAKAKALADFPDDDWLRMLCVEAACVAVPVELKPGDTWVGSQTLAVP